MKNISKKVKVVMLALAVMAFGFGMKQALAATGLTSQAGIGSSGANVSTLQAFLATNPSIYPEGLVTGYFGNLTSQAVSNFQVAYDLPSVGRVGPLTLDTLNRLIVAGRGLDISAPQIYGLNIQRQATKQATFSWYTNENASGKVFYDTRPITAVEATRSFAEPTFNASYVALGSSFVNSQTVTISNLNPGTQYYYVVESIDLSGNVSVTVQGTFTAI